MQTSDGTIENTPIETANPEDIREAILARVQNDQNITRDLKFHDGLTDIAIRWRTLRFSMTLASHGLSPDDIANKVEAEFSKWLLKIIYVDPDPDRQKVNPKAETVINDMRKWAKTKGYTHAG